MIHHMPHKFLFIHFFGKHPLTVPAESQLCYQKASVPCSFQALYLPLQLGELHSVDENFSTWPKRWRWHDYWTLNIASSRTGWSLSLCISAAPSNDGRTSSRRGLGKNRLCFQWREGSGGVTVIAPHSLWLPQSFHRCGWVRKTRKAAPLGKGTHWLAPYAQTAPSSASLLSPLPVLTHLPKVTLQEAEVWPYWRPPVHALGSHMLADWLYLLSRDLVKGYILRWAKRT